VVKNSREFSISLFAGSVFFDSRRFAAKVGRIMTKVLPLFLAAFALVFGACAHHDNANNNNPKKNKPHIYEGNSPTIKFLDEPEAAGGPVHTY